MIWTYPKTFWGLLLLAPLLLASLSAWIRAKRSLASLVASSPSLPVRAFFRDVLMVAFLVFTVFAAANPKGGRNPVPAERSGLDVAVAVDVSRSMLAEDLEPNRLGQAVSLVRSLSRSLADARFSLIPFKGDATLAVPMTEDRVILDLWLDRLGPGLSTVPGTNIEQALLKARESLPGGSARQRAIVLITDGEALSGSLDGVIRDISQDGVPVFAVAAGSEEGVPILLSDGSYVNGPDGNPVISRLDSETLRRIAMETDGEVFDLSRTGTGAALLRELEDRRSFSETRGIVFESVDRFRLFLIPALSFLLLSLIAKVVPWRNG